VSVNESAYVMSMYILDSGKISFIYLFSCIFVHHCSLIYTILYVMHSHKFAQKLKIKHRVRTVKTEMLLLNQKVSAGVSHAKKGRVRAKSSMANAAELVQVEP